MKFIFGFMAVSTLAFAQGHPGGKKDDHFSERKASIQKRVTEEKAMIDQFSSCVGSAQSGDDHGKCVTPDSVF